MDIIDKISNRLSMSLKIAAEFYETHNNGGRLFLVKLDEIGGDKIIDVYHNIHGGGYEGPIYSLDDDESFKVYVGESSGNSDACDHSPIDADYFTGNSVLLLNFDNNFDTYCVFIGDELYKFRLDDGDSISEYYSPVGNSDVPYPIIRGENNIYFMLDKLFVPVGYFPLHQNWENAYHTFYEIMQENPDVPKYPFKDVEIIMNRP